MNLTTSAIFWGVITFSLLVVLHEGGHFLVARAFGIKVHEFMLGLPGPAIRFRGKQTTYGVTAILLGGYVRIAGMEPGPEDPLMADALAVVIRNGSLTPEELAAQLDIDVRQSELLLTTLLDWDALTHEDAGDRFIAKVGPEKADEAAVLLDSYRSHTYRGLSVWKRCAVLSAGVIVNLITAILVFVLVLTLVGQPTTSLKLDSVSPDGAAAAGGMLGGDTVKAIDGVALPAWQSLLDVLATHNPGDAVSITYVRDGTDRTVTVVLGTGSAGKALLGVKASLVNVRSSVGDAFREAFSWVGMVFVAIAGFFNPSTFHATVSQSSSIVGASVAVAEAAAEGPMYYAIIVAFLSLSLGVINIVPIPPLDGGKIAVELLQALFRRQLSRNISLGISAIGALLLFAFIGYLMYADIARLVTSGG